QLTKSELEDLDKLAKILAAQPHAFDGILLRAYHAVTRGWYLNEIVRRVDPKHPIYDLEFYLLLPQNLSSRVATFYHAPITEKIILIRDFLLEWWYKKNSDPFILESIDRKNLMHKIFNSSVPGIPKPFEFKVAKLETFTFESPSVTGITNAKSMAKLGAFFTNNGQPLDDNSNSKPFISKNTIDLISTKLPI
ncbi:30831_t:CDS:2, partial [Gigaspora margarita]